MTAEVYVDFVCPWCYIGHRRLENALTGLQPERRPTIVWRSFQLDPGASTVPSGSAASAMRGWYPAAGEADARIARIVKAGADEGLRLDLDRALPVNTFDAHRLSHLATRHGLAEAMHKQIFSAYHSRGLNIADHEVLTALAVSAGLGRDEVRGMLASDSFGDAVRDDGLRARALGIRSVPTLMAGANPAGAGETLRRALYPGD